MCRTLLSRIRSASDYQLNLCHKTASSLFEKSLQFFRKCWQPYLKGMVEVRALRNSGHSERRSPTRKERAMWGILGASTHVLLIIAGECSNGETSAYLWLHDC